jgi:hypothetical protein
MICIMCPILHKIICIDLKCNGYVLVLIEVELIHIVCSKCIRSIWTKTNTNIITTWNKKHTVVWPLVGMINTFNGHSQLTPSAKGRKGKIQRLDRVSCPDTEIQVLPNLGIAVDRISCPDTNIGVLTTRFPRASCLKETHAFCSRNMGVHVQCTCAKKLVSCDFAKIMHNYVQKINDTWRNPSGWPAQPGLTWRNQFLLVTQPKQD